jgi:large subunit ribosomal protein L30
MTKISVTLINSVIGNKQDQRRTVESLGLKRINHTVVHEDTASIRGMVHKVRHLVRVESAD